MGRRDLDGEEGGEKRRGREGRGVEKSKGGDRGEEMGREGKREGKRKEVGGEESERKGRVQMED